MSFVWFILIGLAAGWLAGQFTKGSGFGVLGNLAIGAVGAILGGFAARLVGIVAYGLLGQLVVTTAGALLLLWLIGLARR